MRLKLTSFGQWDELMKYRFQMAPNLMVCLLLIETDR
jgi:hypothetical protein